MSFEDNVKQLEEIVNKMEDSFPYDSQVLTSNLLHIVNTVFHFYFIYYYLPS